MPRVIPAGWMPTCPKGSIVRLIVHWTAGGPTPSDADLLHYHILCTRSKKLILGEHSIADNVSTADDDYAAHTRRCNTGSIGFAYCGMYGAKESPFKPGPYPLTRDQWNYGLFALADLCEFYEIKPTPTTLLTHAMVEKNLGIRQNGKWDIAVRSWDGGAYAHLTPDEELLLRVKRLLEK